MSFATNVADTPFYGGVFLTQKWFAKHSTPPQVNEYTSLPHFTAANYDLIIEGIHKEEGFCLKVVPQQKAYKGDLYILTNRNTASTCELLVYGLKQYKRATIVGEKTAGAMLNGEFFELADRYRMDKKGVLPDIEVVPDKAMEYVMENLVK